MGNGTLSIIASSTIMSSELTWEGAGDNFDKLAELSGMTYTYDKETKVAIFTDNETGMELKFEEGVMAYHRNDLYIQRIVGMVSQLPLINRLCIPCINVIQEDTPYKGTLGVHTSFKGEFNSPHMITIPTGSVRTHGTNSLFRTLLHESNHAIDYMMGGPKTLGGLSSSKDFKAALKEEGSATKYSKDSGADLTSKEKWKNNSNYLLENYAETGSIVQLKQMGYGTERIKMPNGKTITVDEWCDTHPQLYNVVSKDLETKTEKDFKRTNYYTRALVKDTKKRIFKL